MRNKRKSKKGFTLMELSIVIALVAVVSVAEVIRLIPTTDLF